MLSNGPGDPAENVEIVANIKELLNSDMPIFGICLGHQLPPWLPVPKTWKLKYGHRGANQPVNIPATAPYITSQNHGYAVYCAIRCPRGPGAMSMPTTAPARASPTTIWRLHRPVPPGGVRRPQGYRISV